MPSLPASGRRSRDTREVVAPAAREPAELEANGLAWVHLDSPTKEEATALAERFGWHPLDVEDVLSKRQRPKVDEYDDYRFVVLHFPVYDKAVQRLNAGELDVFLGPDYLVTLRTVELLPVTRLFQRCSDDPELRDNLFGKGSGYLLYHVLDDLFDYCFPILDKIGHKLDVIEDDIDEARFAEIVRHLQGEAGDHQLPQDRQAATADAAGARAARRTVPARGPRAVLRRPRRRVRADLGRAR